MLLLLASLIALGSAPWVDRSLVGRPRASAMLDAAATVLVGGLVLLQILPEALSHGGGMVLAAVAIGALVPAGCGRLPNGELGVVVLATVALALHGLVDGAILATSQEPHSQALAEAVVLHSLPVGLAVWRATASHHGHWVAGVVLGVAVLSEALGFAAAELIPVGGSALAVAQAFVAGSLLHLISHRSESPERLASGVGALIGGVGVVALIGSHAGPAVAPDELGAWATAWGLAAEAGPWLLAGLAIAPLLARPLARWPRVAEALAGRSPGLPALLVSGALLGPWWTLLWALSLLATVRPSRSPPVLSYRHALVRDLVVTAPWWLLGLLVAGWGEALLAPDRLVGVPWVALWLAAWALGAWAAPAGAGLVVVLAVLSHKGLSPGAALIALSTGPIITSSVGRRVRWGAMVSVLALGVCVDVLLPMLPSPALHGLAGHAHGWVEGLALIVLAVAGLTVLLIRGLGDFLAGLHTTEPHPGPG